MKLCSKSEERLLMFQRCWREFFEKHNRAATVIQTAWRSSMASSKLNHGNGDEHGSGTRPGRLRYVNA